MNNHPVELPIATRDGRFIARYSENGLAELDFPKAGQASSRAGKRNGRAELPVSPNARQLVPAEIRHWHRITETALKGILVGKPPKEFPPLDPAGTDFQKKVWNALRKIPPGKTKSYGEIAEAIGKPKAVRAVGGACGANPIPVFVPCHRVLAAHGKIGGFGGGLEWKRKLLSEEGVTLPSAG